MSMLDLTLNTEENQEELSDTNSLLNRLGYDIVNGLNKIRKCYYWWHTYFETMDYCPKCGGLLREYNNDYEGANKVCETCNILLNDTH